jgi:hypothetical protein
MPNMTMSTPVGTRVSMRANKGQTSKYDDFVQQITLMPAYPTWQQKINQTWSPDTAYVQQLACDGHCQTPWSPTYRNTDMASQQGVMMNDNMMYGNMMNSNMMTNNSGNMMNANVLTNNMVNNNSGNMMNTTVLTNNMMNTNMMNSNVMAYNSGYLNNDGYSGYEDSSP